MSSTGKPTSALASEAQEAIRAPVAGSPERISELIGDIYDCVLDPGNWERVLASLNREFCFAFSALGVMPLRAGGFLLSATSGENDAEWRAIADSDLYRAESVRRWGGPKRMAQYPLDEPIVASQAAADVDWSDNLYCRDILEPRGIIDTVAILLASGPSLRGYVAFSRHQSAGEIGQRELDSLRLLGPHLRRAVTISNLFDMKAIEAASFASVLDSFAFGLVLVDARLGIVHANDIAANMLAASDAVESRNGILVLRDQSSQEALERAVHQAMLDEAAMGSRGIGIPARRATGEPCVIHVLPLKRGEMRRGLAQRATAALFIAPASVSSRVPSDALAMLYDLTPAEARIFEMITEGQTQGAIAATLGIARSTVKSHLLHVFAKTGCKRQLDLANLVSSLRSPV